MSVLKEFNVSFCSDENSWINIYISKWIDDLKGGPFKLKWSHNFEDLLPSKICFILGYEKIISKNLLKKNEYNIVVHESNLPKGRGWSPLTWQILEGKQKIVVSLFEATEKIDEGPIYLQDHIILDGAELIDELRFKQADITYKLCNSFLNQYKKFKNKKKYQKGQATYYKKRKPSDSQLDINLSLKQQFNLLRVCDNEKYPAWFRINDQKYLVKVYKEKDNTKN